MRTILFMLQKEFLQVFRNKQMLPIIFILPVVQLILLSYAATFEIKKINMYVMDGDNTTASRRLAGHFWSTGYFIPVNSSHSDDKAQNEMAANRVKMIMKIPHGFEKDIITNSMPKVQFIINAEDGSAAGIIQTFSAAVLNNYNMEVIGDFSLNIHRSSLQTIGVSERFLYNAELNYKLYMVPGILSVLVTIIGMFLSGMNIVKEKEIGTIEQLNVTPIRKSQFIIGKLLPFWIISMFELAWGLILAKLIFHIVILGNIFLIFALAALYLLVVLSLGLLISTLTDTQQQAMFIAWFFAVIFILMSGLFTPLDSMPGWAQTVARFNPVAHFVEIMRRVMLKGAGIGEVTSQVLALSAYAFSVLVLSIWRYRKVSG